MLSLLLCIWLIPGLIGREPWMNDEPYTFGIINNMAKNGDWVVPTIAGEPFVEKPPLYFLTGAAFELVGSPFLELYDSARLASGFYMMLVLLFISLSTKELLSGEHAEIALLVLLGCTALVPFAHKMITDTALMAGFSISFYGLSLARRRLALGGVWTGVGVGVGFLSKGLLAPGSIALTAVALPIFSPSWRKKNYYLSLIIALVSASPWLLIWPYALYQRSPALFKEWFWVQNFGRFLGFWKEGVRYATPGSAHSLGKGIHHLKLGRLAVPVLPLALWSLWYHRRSWRENPIYQLPLTMFMVILIVLGISVNTRSIYAFPLLIPLSVIAAAGVETMSSRMKATITRANIALFSLIAALLWGSWFVFAVEKSVLASQTFPTWAPDFNLSFHGIHFVAALACTAIWMYAMIFRAHFQSTVIYSWTMGITLVWCLAMTLWLPALNERESYRNIFTSLREFSYIKNRCIAIQGLDDNGRAMLEYYAGIRTRKVDEQGLDDCDLLLVGNESNTSNMDPAWKLLWEKKRPRKKSKEVFRLYQRIPRILSYKQ